MSQLNNPYYINSARYNPNFAGPDRPSYDLSGEIGKLDLRNTSDAYSKLEAPTEAQQGVEKAVSAIPIVGQAYAAGTGIASSIRDKDPASIKNQQMSDLWNPSHGFATAMKTGNWRDAIPLVGGRVRAKREMRARKREREEFEMKQDRFNQQNMRYAQSQASQAEYFDSVQDRQQQMTQGLYGIPQQF